MADISFHITTPLKLTLRIVYPTLVISIAVIRESAMLYVGQLQKGKWLKIVVDIIDTVDFDTAACCRPRQSGRIKSSPAIPVLISPIVSACLRLCDRGTTFRHVHPRGHPAHVRAGPEEHEFMAMTHREGM